MTGTFPSLKSIGGHNTALDLGIGIPAVALGGLGLAGLGGLGAAGAAGAADVGAGAAAAGAPLDLLAGGTAAGTAIPAAVGDIVAPSGALASGLATEPGFASSVAGSFAPGLSTGTGFLAGLAPPGGGVGGAGPAAPGAGGLSNAAISGLESSPGASAFGDLSTIGPGAPAPSAGLPTDLNPAAGAAAAASSPAAGGGLSSLFPAGSGNLAAILGLGLGGQLLAPSLMNALGLNKVPQQGALESIAKQAQGLGASQQAYGTSLEQPLATGVLPAPQQAQVDQALESANAVTKSKFANLGLSGSTMEAEALAQNQQNSLAVQATIETQMAQTGQAAIGDAVSALGIQDSTIGQIMNAQVAQDTALQQSIGQFAAAVGGATALGNIIKPKTA